MSDVQNIHAAASPSRSRPERTPAERLATPVQFIPGVGPRRAELLARLDLHTAADILFQFPRDYQDLTDLRFIRDLEPDLLQSVHGEVADVELRATGTGKSLLGVLLKQDAEYLRALWFNQPYLREKFHVGDRLLMSGKPKKNALRWEMVHPRVQWLEDDEQPPAGKLLPVYPLTEGLSQAHMRKAAEGALALCGDALEEAFPEDFLTEHRLWPIRRALLAIHSPESREALNRARRRFVYQELLVLQLALALKRREYIARATAPALETTARIDARIRRLFPFPFTPGQEQAIQEVTADIAQPVPMHRLLQGDVGSGKTVVALYAILAAVANGHGRALMAPTEVLARQHAQTLGQLLSQGRVRTCLWTGGQPTAERQRLAEDVHKGRIDVVIGTQAIIQGDLQFAKLGLVVIDEQHKFGVRQRAVLKQAGVDPHYLVMTATPIPRTIALTLYGDLDVSTLRDAPPGRQRVHTYFETGERRAQWWHFVRRKLREGRQAFVIAPLVEESEQLEAADATSLHRALVAGELTGHRVDLLHGRLSPAEKEAAMQRFRSGQTQVLVATSVVEVGIDVPNATLMTIEGGERFGLAQLHQLRGRISRGTHSGFCCVFAQPQTEEAQKRLAAFKELTDGFALAETDFELRGPGELFGTRQHGLPTLYIADLNADQDTLTESRRDAQALVADDAWQRPEFARLRALVQQKYGLVFELGSVG